MRQDYGRRAEEARAKAKEMTSDETRNAMDAVARSYDLLAADARKRESLKLTVVGRHLSY
jgi:hypothetical protein